MRDLSYNNPYAAPGKRKGKHGYQHKPPGQGPPGQGPPGQTPSGQAMPDSAPATRMLSFPQRSYFPANQPQAGSYAQPPTWGFAAVRSQPPQACVPQQAGAPADGDAVFRQRKRHRGSHQPSSSPP